MKAGYPLHYLALTPEQFKWLMQGFSIDPIIHDINPRFSA